MEKKNDNKLTFWQFLCKYGFFIIIVSCLIPFVMNYLKSGILDFKSLPVSFLAAFALTYCVWKASTIKL